jgi:hypothetical protein
MRLLTLPAVAAQLSVSLSLVQKLARAAEYAAEIQTGKRHREDVPPGLVLYLDSGFPIPKRIGKSVRRIKTEELEKWLK